MFFIGSHLRAEDFHPDCSIALLESFFEDLERLKRETREKENLSADIFRLASWLATDGNGLDRAKELLERYPNLHDAFEAALNERRRSRNSNTE
jgi:hypothetical protein